LIRASKKDKKRLHCGKRVLSATYGRAHVALRQRMPYGVLMDNIDHQAIVAEAVRLGGGPTELARHLGIASQAISQWTRIPVGRVIAIEAITGLPREYLRPDIYGAPRPRPPHHRRTDSRVAA
jgi:DNA-binding transcriptional regulator YdaS (Cro superfamily)